MQDAVLSLTSDPGERQRMRSPLPNRAGLFLRSGFWLLAFLRSLKLALREVGAQKSSRAIDPGVISPPARWSEREIAGVNFLAQSVISKALQE